MVQFVVTCDHYKCPSVSRMATTWVRARYLGEQDGWQKVKRGKAYKDYCPDHRQKEP